MTRSPPNPPPRPLTVRLLLRLYRGLASLQLAVVLIVLLAIVLAWATVVENRFGLHAAQFAIYRTWWFEALNFLLGLNVVMAAVVRFPWKRRQIGFLLTHAGILVLLLGCVVTRQQGIDAHVRVIEGDTTHRAVSDWLQHFELDVTSTGGKPGMTIKVPFRAGPFNWNEYGDTHEDPEHVAYETRFWFPWRLGRRDRGVIYDQEGIRLEVLDYYSDSQYVRTPRVKLEITDLRMLHAHAMGHVGSTSSPRISTELGCLADDDPAPPNLKYGVGEVQRFSDGTRFAFWMTGSRKETEAFLDGCPELPIGDRGNVVLVDDGRKYEFSVSDYYGGQWSPSEISSAARFPLGETELEIEVRACDPSTRQVELVVYRGAAPAGILRLSAANPGRSQQDYQNEIFGSYWDNQNPRVDILQGLEGDDPRLYYRTWDGKSLCDAAEWPTDGSSIVVFAEEDALAGNDPAAVTRPLEIRLEKFVADDEPGKLVPKPFYKGKENFLDVFVRRHALLNLSVDGNTEQFWLEGLPGYPYDKSPRTTQSKVVEGVGRNVEVRLRWYEFDLGYSVYLDECVEEPHAGTNMPKGYSSIVYFLGRDFEELLRTAKLSLGDLLRKLDPDWEEPLAEINRGLMKSLPGPDAGPGELASRLREDPGKLLLDKKTTIAMNAPVDVTDPKTGQSGRLSQSGMMGPITLSDQDLVSRAFRQQVGEKTERENVYLTSLGFRIDPGVGLKHAGSLLMLVGVVFVLYAKMRVYRKPSRPNEPRPDDPPNHEVGTTC